MKHTNRVIPMEDLPDIYYSCDNPSQGEIWAVDQLVAMVEDRKIRLGCVIVRGNRCAAVFPGGENYLEYEFDQHSGELLEVESKSPEIKEFIDLIYERTSAEEKTGMTHEKYEGMLSEIESIKSNLQMIESKLEGLGREIMAEG